MTIASIYSQEIEETYFRSDIDSDLQKIQIPHTDFRLKESEQKILKSIDNKADKVKDIVDETDLSESTVYRRLGDLEQKNIIEEKEEGYRKTLTGEIIS
ncbi:MAG: helix-turn-helix transcriptional regulator [Candidatus Nanohalobium sp.]